MPFVIFKNLRFRMPLLSTSEMMMTLDFRPESSGAWDGEWRCGGCWRRPWRRAGRCSAVVYVGRSVVCIASG
jgi:hypothetical protein